MAAFASTKLYPDMSQLIGSGQYKRVYGATNINKDEAIDELIGIESTESPENVVVAVCITSEQLLLYRIIDEILLQAEFSRKTDQLAPYIYGVVIKKYNGTFETYVGEDLVKGKKTSNINNHIKALSFGETVYIYQQRCDSDLYTHLKKGIEKINSKQSHYNNIDHFLEDIHRIVKETNKNIVDAEYIASDVKSKNYCWFNSKKDESDNEIASSKLIGMDVDPLFVHPFMQKMRKALWDSGMGGDEQVYTITKVCENIQLYMLIQYYIVFLYETQNRFSQQVSQLLMNDMIGYREIQNMLYIIDYMENPKFKQIFKYGIDNFTPTFMLKHYLSNHLKIGKPRNYNPWIELDRMTMEALATKICEILGLLKATSLSTGSPEKSISSPEKSTTSPEKSTTSPEKSISSPEKSTSSPEKSISSPEKTISSPEKSTGILENLGGSRHRPRKMNSRKKHLNKRTHKTINARTSKSNPK